MVIQKMKELNPIKKIAFVVDKIPLVEQQHAKLKEDLKLNITKIRGGQSRDTLISDADVYVIMDSVFFAMLSEKIFAMEDFSLVVFDEAHHAVKDHVYVKIMKLIDTVTAAKKINPKSPKILGLTASPAVDNSPITTIFKFGLLSNALHCAIKAPDETMDFGSLMEKKSPLFIESPITTMEMKFKGILVELNKEAILHVEEQIIDLNEDLNDDDDDESKTKFDKIVIGNESWVRRVFELTQDLFNFGINVAYEAAIKYIQETKMQVSQELMKKMEACKSSSTERCSKADTLIQILHKEPTLKSIIFVKTRSQATTLCTILSENFPGMDILKVVGHGSSSHGGMTSSDQISRVNKFKDTKSGVIVATSVLEEGIDITDCTHVISFCNPPTVLALIQRRGRLRQLLDRSKFLVVFKHLEEKSEFENLIKNEKKCCNCIGLLKALCRKQRDSRC